MTKRMATLSRRNFLLAAGAGGAAAAAALAAKSPLPARPVPGDADRRATRGYQASAHVHHYYRTTKV